MRWANALAATGFAVMAGALIYGFTVGDFWGEGSVLTRMPWGIVSLLDVYVGFALFCGWIVFRERSLPRAAIWVVLVLTLGNLVASGYALLALARSRGNWEAFWMGTGTGAAS